MLLRGFASQQILGEYSYGQLDNITPPRDQSDSLDPAQRSEAYTPRTDSPGGPGEVRRERWRPEWVYCRFCPKIGCPRMLLLPDCKPQNASPVHVQLGRGCTRIRHHGRLSAHIHLQFLSFPLSSVAGRCSSEHPIRSCISPHIPGATLLDRHHSRSSYFLR